MNGETECVYIQWNIIKMKEILTHATIWMNFTPYAKIDSEVKVTHSCLTLCDPMDYTINRILQARILEWVAFPFPGDLPNPRIKPRSLTLQADSLSAEPQGKPKNVEVSQLVIYNDSACQL